jgi:two-component system, NtrC family, sensor kinase
MKRGRAFDDLPTPISAAPSVTEGLAQTLRRLVDLTGATAGAVAVRPRDQAPIVVTAGTGRTSVSLRRWLTTIAATPARGARVARVVPPGASRGRTAALLRTPLGAPGRPVGELVLLGRSGSLTASALPASLARELGTTIERRCARDRLALRAAVLNGITGLLASRHTLDEVFAAFAEGAAKLVRFDSISVSLLDAVRGEFELIDLPARGLPASPSRGTWMALEGTLLARVVAAGSRVRVDDLARDAVPAASHRVLAAGGYRTVALVPLAAGGTVLGAVTLAAARPGAFDDTDLDVVTELARPLALAIERSRLAEGSVRGARETRALLEAGRAVTASLDVGRTIQVLLEGARGVLGVDSCGLLTIDPATDELVMAASLDMPPATVATVRLRPGEGVTGRAVQQRRPMQSRDLWADARAKYPHLARTSGFRSMLVVPLLIGDHAIGALSVLRHDVHDFSAHEEELLVALADQAAIALEHARLYTELEGMVADRTRELDTQKRFVEVVLETLPLGVFVLDADLNVVRVNRAGARALSCDADGGGPLARFLPDDRVALVQEFLREAFRSRHVGSIEEEMIVAGDAKIFRLTAAPVESASDRAAHAVLLVEDVTRAKGLERQMLLTERLTTAGRLAAGVAHELNNPLATIAGCAESLQGRLGHGDAATTAAADDFRHYLGLIEEEAYRCKEITGSLLQFVRDPGSRRDPTDLNGVVLKAVELLARQSRFAASRVTTELDPALPPVAANEGQLRQVCLGLASNALEAMDGRGILTIRSRLVRGEIEIELEDEGPGIPEENLSRIFDPFFTTKPPGQGTGLGLAIAQGIVTDHGGRIEVRSAPGTGSVFRVVLPL